MCTSAGSSNATQSNLLYTKIKKKYRSIEALFLNSQNVSQLKNSEHIFEASELRKAVTISHVGRFTSAEGFAKR